MFFQSGNAGREVRSQMRGGQGNVEIFHVIKEGLPAKCRMFSEIKLVPGSSIGYHTHEGETEIFLVKSGVAEVMDDDQLVTAYPGDAVATYSGHGHSVKCAGNEPLLMTAVIIRD